MQGCVDTEATVDLLAGQPCLHTGRGWYRGLAAKVLGNHTSLWGDVRVMWYKGEECVLTTWGVAMDVPIVWRY